MIDDLLERCRFAAPGTSVVCAVSGGADSLALLVLAAAAELDVTAVQVDHGLRPGSHADADLVAAAARTYGAGFRAESVTVAPGPNLEARARAARYDALPADALTGHTLDDQAETVLLHLLRGAGVAGLGAMADDRRRPLLRLRRSETRALCAAEGLDPVEDPMNTDPRFRRNRVRHELLPLLDDIAERDVAAVLAAQADVAAAEDRLLDELAAGIDPTDTRAARHADEVLVRRAVRRWLRQATPDGQPPDRAAVERVLAVIAGERRATEIAGSVRVERSAGRLRIVPAGEEAGDRQ